VPSKKKKKKNSPFSIFKLPPSQTLFFWETGRKRKGKKRGEFENFRRQTSNQTLPFARRSHEEGKEEKGEEKEKKSTVNHKSLHGLLKAFNRP